MLSSESEISRAIQATIDKKLLSGVSSESRDLAPRDNLAVITSAGPAGDLDELALRAASFAENKDAANTRRAYASDLKDFRAWCDGHHLVPLPAEPQTIALYITTLADRCKFGTIRRRLVAINRIHRECGLAKVSGHPVVAEILRGIANVKGTASRQKSALTVDLLREALSTLDGSLRGNRDRAILLLGFSGAFRRSELAGLLVSDLRFTRKGLVVTLRRSKTDQAGEGREVGIPYVSVMSQCPVRAAKNWLDAARISEGFVFRTIVGGVPTEHRIADVAVADIVKRAAAKAGLGGDFAGHSLRAGFVTSADSKGASAYDIMRVTGHKSRAMLDKYSRKASLFDDAPLTKIMR